MKRSQKTSSGKTKTRTRSISVRWRSQSAHRQEKFRHVSVRPGPWRTSVSVGTRNACKSEKLTWIHELRMSDVTIISKSHYIHWDYMGAITFTPLLYKYISFFWKESPVSQSVTKVCQQKKPQLFPAAIIQVRTGTNMFCGHSTTLHVTINGQKKKNTMIS